LPEKILEKIKLLEENIAILEDLKRPKKCFNSRYIKKR